MKPRVCRIVRKVDARNIVIDIPFDCVLLVMWDKSDYVVNVTTRDDNHYKFTDVYSMGVCEV